MTRRVVGLLGWSAWAGSVLFFGLALLVIWVSEPDSFVGFLVFAVGFLAFPTVGALIVSHQPRNSIGWIFCAVGLLIGFWFFAGQYAVYTLVTAPGSLPGGVAVAWFGSWAGEPGWGLITTFLPLLFPTGRLPSPRWRPVAWCAGIVIALQVAGDLLRPGPFQLHSMGGLVPPEPNPTGIAALAGAGDLISNALSALFLIVAIPCLASIIVRYRRAKGIERIQIKWFAYAIFLVPTAFLAVNPVAPSNAGDPLQIVGGVVFVLAIAAFPAAVGIAILRYRLWDIDNLINRTLVYGVLTALLVTVYLGSVVLIEALLRPVTGNGHNDPAVVISTLLIAGLFLPLRRAVQAFIDRRFYRRKYDAARTLATFSACARDEVDLDSLTGRLLEAVQETMQPAHVSVWLRAELGQDAGRIAGSAAGRREGA